MFGMVKEWTQHELVLDVVQLELLQLLKEVDSTDIEYVGEGQSDRIEEVTGSSTLKCDSVMLDPSTRNMLRFLNAPMLKMSSLPVYLMRTNKVSRELH